MRHAYKCVKKMKRPRKFHGGKKRERRRKRGVKVTQKRSFRGRSINRIKRIEFQVEEKQSDAEIARHWP